MRIAKKFISFSSVFITISCTQSEIVNNITYIDFNNCDPVLGCTVTFPFVTSPLKTLGSLVPSSLTADTSLGWDINQITINQAFGLWKKGAQQTLPLLPFTPITTNTIFPDDYRAEQRSPWMENTLNCQVSNKRGQTTCNLDDNFNDTTGCFVTCTGFYPIATNFTLNGSIQRNGPFGPTRSPLTQTFIVTLSSPNKGGTDATCGYLANTPVTTYQRIFDCYAKVQKSAGFGNLNQGSTPFIASDICTSGMQICDPDLNWFLVYSPTTNPDDRFWLSPVLKADNPVVGINQQMTIAPFRYFTESYDTFKAGWKMSSIIGQRLLWSGVSKNPYNFFQANGTSPYDLGKSNDAGYGYYSEESRGQIAIQNINSIIPDTPSLCDPISGTCAWFYNPDSTLHPRLDSDYKTSYNSPLLNEYSICDRVKLPMISDPILLSEIVTFKNNTTGEVYEWQMPSYPMVMTLTGGDDYCDTTASTQLAVCNPDGFRAISEIPGFNFSGATSGILWSSSVLNSYHSWLFFYSTVGGTELENSYHVRCVSAAW